MSHSMEDSSRPPAVRTSSQPCLPEQDLLHAAAGARELVTLGEFTRVALLTPISLRTSALSIASPLACTAVGFFGRDFDPSLLSLIIAVPSSISINAAYQRRERALTYLCEFRSATYALHHAVQRWGQPADRTRLQQEQAALFESLCNGLEAGGEDVAFRGVYRHLELIGDVLESVRLTPRRPEEATTYMPALFTVLCSDERKLIEAIEALRMLSRTGTPFLLRGFTVGGTTLFPVLFGPYFADAARGADFVDAWAAYLLSFLLAVTISSLVSIQEALEDPFDGDSRLDDIALGPFSPPGFSLFRSDAPDENRYLVNPPDS